MPIDVSKSSADMTQVIAFEATWNENLASNFSFNVMRWSCLQLSWEFFKSSYMRKMMKFYRARNQFS